MNKEQLLLKGVDLLKELTDNYSNVRAANTPEQINLSYQHAVIIRGKINDLIHQEGLQFNEEFQKLQEVADKAVGKGGDKLGVYA
jgi:hypothetical protein